MPLDEFNSLEGLKEYVKTSLKLLQSLQNKGFSINDVLTRHRYHLDDVCGDDELNEAYENVLQEHESFVHDIKGALESLKAKAKLIEDEMDNIKTRFKVGEKMIQVQEEERRRVARDIHDGPAQALANIVLRIEICEKLIASGRSEVHQEISQLKQLVKESLKEVRKTIFNLRPMTLDDLGLVPTLERYLDNIEEQEHAPVHLKVRGPKTRLKSAVEVAVFRTVQEAVNNAQRHAQANRIDVTLEFGDDTLVITIKDDGVGFDYDQLKKEWADRESFGILNMQERIELLSGEFDIKSLPGKGTTVIAKVVLNNDLMIKDDMEDE